MRRLGDQAHDYLRLRRALGHNLDMAHRLLPDFVAYLDAVGAATVTIDAALAWAQRPEAGPATSVWARRMTVARGFARRTGDVPAALAPTVHLLRGRHHRVAIGRSPDDPHPDADRDRRDTRRAARRDRHAGRRGDPLRAGRPRHGRRLDHRAPVEVREIPAGAPPGQHPRRPVRLRRAARPALAQTEEPDVFHLDRRHPAPLRRLLQDVPEAGPSHRRGSRRTTPSQDPRHAPQLCCPHPGRVVSGGRGCRRPLATAGHVFGSPRPVLHLLVSLGRPRAAGLGRRASGSRAAGTAMSKLAPTLQLFFTERLAKQLQASPRTVTSYRDTFRLLLRFVQDRTSKAPSTLGWEDVGVDVISAFLDHLQADRHNSARSRNTRLAALRSLFRYAALRHPEHAELIGQVLAIPQKRFDKTTVSFLDAEEVRALLGAPDIGRWEGRRDRTLIALAVQTGLRLSELIGLNCGDVELGTAAHVHCTGKGRKERCVPMTAPTVAMLRVWLRERAGRRDEPLFPTRTGRRLSDDAVERQSRHPQGKRRPALPVPPHQETDTARPAAHQCHVPPAPGR